MEVYTDIPQPADRKQTLKDILDEDVEQKYFVSEQSLNGFVQYNERQRENKNGFKVVFYSQQSKMPCITTKYRRRDLVIVQRGHGFNKCGVFAEKTPTLTASSWEHNNYVVELTPQNAINLVGGKKINAQRNGTFTNYSRLVQVERKGNTNIQDAR